MTKTEKKEKEEDDEALTGNCVYKTSEAEAETGLNDWKLCEKTWLQLI